jgi:hypothetical protein
MGKINEISEKRRFFALMNQQQSVKCNVSPLQLPKSFSLPNDTFLSEPFIIINYSLIYTVTNRNSYIKIVKFCFNVLRFFRNSTVVRLAQKYFLNACLLLVFAHRKAVP